MMEDLKRCPFCDLDMELINIPWCNGDDCFEFRHSDEDLAIEKNCPVAKEGYGSEDDAVRAWNERNERTCQKIPCELTIGGRFIEDRVKCSECDQIIEDDDNFCWNCGAKVVDE